MVMVGVLLDGAMVTGVKHATASDVTLEPGLWSLDNFGEVLIATIANGKTFTWNGGAASALDNRASTQQLVLKLTIIQQQQELHLYHQQLDT